MDIQRLLGILKIQHARSLVIFAQHLLTETKRIASVAIFHVSVNCVRGGGMSDSPQPEGADSRRAAGGL